MFFFISKLLGGLTSPATILAILIVCSGLALLLRRFTLALFVHFSAIALILAFIFLPLANWLTTPLEARFSSHPKLPDQVAGIIVLGGTERVEESAFWRQPELSDPGQIAAMLMLARRYPEAKLVFSGGGHSRIDPAIGEATVVHDLIAELGADPDKVIYENRSRNTHENAVFSFAKVHPTKDESWILICQAIGMPRAVGIFRHEGWKIIPFPAGYLGAGNKDAILPSSFIGSLALAAMAMHEWVGLAVYRLMDYTDEFFPR